MLDVEKEKERKIRNKQVFNVSRHLFIIKKISTEQEETYIYICFSLLNHLNGFVVVVDDLFALSRYI